VGTGIRAGGPVDSGAAAAALLCFIFFPRLAAFGCGVVGYFTAAAAAACWVLADLFGVVERWGFGEGTLGFVFLHTVRF